MEDLRKAVMEVLSRDEPKSLQDIYREIDTVDAFAVNYAVYQLSEEGKADIAKINQFPTPWGGVGLVEKYIRID